ncbi:hypothetical protein [Cellulosilyticum sp. I15G10I2]|uniref:hypothetical protein n=1 Tax=Cellulosilyticum sp. I15G10I2 TaxID=1892843 RepID=UPI0014960C7E|nr:hypothetical protein [Cellulosilyticum sp. I15G10I2]
MTGVAIFSVINLIIILLFIAIGSYSFVLFVKLMRRGIKALDIYISKNSEEEINLH